MMKILSTISSIIIIASFAISTVHAQDVIEPNAGINKNYFLEDISDKDQKKIDELKKKVKDLNVNLKGEWIKKEDNKAEYEKCVKVHKEREKDAQKFIPPKKKASTKSTKKKTTTKTTTTKKTTSKAFDSAPYYNNERCFDPGWVDEVKYWQKLFKKASCSFGDTQIQTTKADMEKQFSELQSYLPVKGDFIKKFEACKNEAIQENATAKAAAPKNKSGKPKEGKTTPACKQNYGYWRGSVCATEVIIKARKQLQTDLKKLEHPELYNCEFKEENGKAVINNIVCVEFTERLGRTKVIGAKSGIGLLKAYIALIYRYAAIIVGLIAVLMIIISGIQISTGGEEEMTAAKKRLGNALAGLAILFLSGAILYIINPNFFTF